MKRKSSPRRRPTAAEKAEMKAWMRRWKIVNEVQTREWLAATPARRLHELETMFHFAHSVGRRGLRDREVTEVRRRWLRLKRHGGV